MEITRRFGSWTALEKEKGSAAVTPSPAEVGKNDWMGDEEDEGSELKRVERRTKRKPREAKRKAEEAIKGKLSGERRRNSGDDGT